MGPGAWCRILVLIKEFKNNCFYLPPVHLRQEAAGGAARRLRPSGVDAPGAFAAAPADRSHTHTNKCALVSRPHLNLNPPARSPRPPAAAPSHSTAPSGRPDAPPLAQVADGQPLQSSRAARHSAGLAKFIKPWPAGARSSRPTFGPISSSKWWRRPRASHRLGTGRLPARQDPYHARPTESSKVKFVRPVSRPAGPPATCRHRKQTICIRPNGLARGRTT